MKADEEKTVETAASYVLKQPEFALPGFAL